MVQLEIGNLDVWVLIDVVISPRIEQRSTVLDAMNDVDFL